MRTEGQNLHRNLLDLLKRESSFPQTLPSNIFNLFIQVSSVSSSLSTVDLPKENVSETVQNTPKLIWVIARWCLLHVFEEFIIFVQALVSALPRQQDSVPMMIRKARRLTIVDRFMRLQMFSSLLSPSFELGHLLS